MGRVLLLFVLLGCSIHSAFCSTPDFPRCPPYLDVAGTWAGKNYDQALETLMPNNIATTIVEGQWILSVRLTPSFFDELQFTFVKYPDGKVHGMAASPSNGSIGDQLISLKKTHPEKELNELINMIELDRWQITFDSNKELENKIRFIQNYKPRPERKDVICLDGTGYEISLQMQTKKIDFSFGCDTERAVELVQLVNEFHDLLYGYKQIDYDLLTALEKKDVRLAIQLIEDGANPEFRTVEGDQSWLTAVSLRNPELIKLILQKKPKLIHHSIPVLNAASYGSAEIVAILSQAHADINENFRDETPLIAAADYEDKALEIINRTANDFELVVNELIKAGADLNKKRDDGMTALMLAISNRHETIAATLIDAGAEVDTVDNCGNTALILAAREGLNDNVKKLLRAGANPKTINAYGKTAIDYASEEGNQELIRLLN